MVGTLLFSPDIALLMKVLKSTPTSQLLVDGHVHADCQMLASMHVLVFDLSFNHFRKKFHKNYNTFVTGIQCHHRSDSRRSGKHSSLGYSHQPLLDRNSNKQSTYVIHFNIWRQHICRATTSTFISLQKQLMIRSMV